LGSDRTVPTTKGAVMQNGSIDGTNGWFRLTTVFRPGELYLLSDVGTNGSQQNYSMQNPFSDGTASLRHPGPKGLNVAFADGHVELLPRLQNQPSGATNRTLPWWNRP
jgi:prepilin-type processing-associated H-X9-DG protein